MAKSNFKYCSHDDPGWCTEKCYCKHFNLYFSKILEEDASMHYYCSDCGARDTEFKRWKLPEKQMDGQTLKTGEKKDEGKIRWELLPYDAIRSVGEILTLGAIKYSARNWELGIEYGRVFGAVQRHLTSWWMGENLDTESGKSHLDHALTELMFLSAYEKRGMKEFDDRPRKS